MDVLDGDTEFSKFLTTCHLTAHERGIVYKSADVVIIVLGLAYFIFHSIYLLMTFEP